MKTIPEEESQSVDMTVWLPPGEVVITPWRAQHGAETTPESMLDELFERGLISPEQHGAGSRLASLRFLAFRQNGYAAHRDVFGRSPSDFDPMTRYTRVLRGLTPRNQMIISSIFLHGQTAKALGVVAAFLSEALEALAKSFDALESDRVESDSSRATGAS